MDSNHKLEVELEQLRMAMVRPWAAGLGLHVCFADPPCWLELEAVEGWPQSELSNAL